MGQKRITSPFNASEIMYVITKDGKLWSLDKNNKRVCINGEGGPLPSCDVLLDMAKAGDELNSPGGAYFETTKAILNNYRFYAFTYRVRAELKESIGERMQSSSDFSQPLKLTARDEDDIKDFISLYADIKGVPDQLQRFAAKSENLVLSSSIIEIVANIINIFMESSNDELQQAGELLYDRYISPEYENEKPVFFEKISTFPHATYSRKLNAAIACLSRQLFGIFPDDSTLLKFKIEEEV